MLCLMQNLMPQSFLVNLYKPELLTSMKYLFNCLIVCLLLHVSSLFSQETEKRFLSGQVYVKLAQSFVNDSVTLETKASPAIEAFFADFVSDFGITRIKSSFAFSNDAELRAIQRVYFDSTHKVVALLSRLESSAEVVFAEQIPYSTFQLFPNDLGPNTTTGSGQWYLHKIRAPQAWDIQTGNPEIRVAVLDDAFELAHPDLSGIFLPGRDVVMDDFDVTPPSVLFSHGTHVSGVIAANTGNNLGIASLAFGVKVIPIKITDDSNFNIPQALPEGIAWAASSGADVINMSWGVSDLNQTLLLAIQSAANAGIVLVAAAGNSPTNTVVYPAGFPQVISVAATTNTDARASFSSFGSWVDVCAPGDKIYSTIPYSEYGQKQGTSFAAPLVSALAALILSLNPGLSAEQVKDCILTTSDNINVFNPTQPGLLGSGRINAQKALQCAAAYGAEFDASLTTVLAPAAASCITQFTPVIRIKNIGTAPLTSAKVRMVLDNTLFQEVIWTGNLATNNTDFVIFPSISASPGNHTLRFVLNQTLNETNIDMFAGNNEVVHAFSILSPLGSSLPFTENFEGASVFDSDWTVQNLGSLFSWEIAPISSFNYGARAARLPYHSDMMVGQQDYLISKTFDFSGLSTATLSFGYAYRQRTPGFTDSLRVSVSTDCGNTWFPVFSRGENGTNSFNTTAANEAFFIPQLDNQWCGSSGFASCVSINLNAYIGVPGVQVRFEGENYNGNNIYIDNINIQGAPLGLAPVAGFSAFGNEVGCVNAPIQFTSTSLNQPTSYEWSFPGGLPATSIQANPMITYATEGSYTATLIASNQFGVDTITIENVISILDLPPLTLTASSDTICRGNQVVLEADGALYYSWLAGTTVISEQNQITTSPQNTVTYTVNGYSAEGCRASLQKTIVVVELPTPPTITIDNELLVSSEASVYQWILNGVNIPGANQQTYTPIQNGSYNVRITTSAGCISVSAPVFVTFVGLSPLEVDQLIQLFPQPAKNELFISAVKTIEFIEVFDLSGREVLQLHAPNRNALGNYTISIPEDLKGIYLMKLLISGTLHYKRFIAY